MRNLAILCMAIILVIPITGLSQDEKGTADKTRLRPSEIDRAIEYNIAAIKNSKYIYHLLKYNEVKNEKTDKKLSQKPTGGDLEELLYAGKYMAEEKCSLIKNERFRELCSALELNNCGLADMQWKEIFCTGILQQDPDLMSKAMEGTELEATRGWCLYLLGIYYGFKSDSLQTCESYMEKIDIDDEDVPLCDQMACQLLFSNENEKALDDVIKDLAILNLSRTQQRDDICQRIKNDRIRNACLDLKIKKLKDIFW